MGENKARVAVGIVAHDDWYFLAPTLNALRGLPCFVFVSDVDWTGVKGDTSRLNEVSRQAGATVIEGSWPSEREHRIAAYEYLREAGFTHALIPDTDEVLEEKLLATLLKLAEEDLADRIYVTWDAYWKTPEYVIRPRERFTPCILINLERAKHTKVRDFEGGRTLVLDSGYGIIHHLSYVGPDERIWKKITTWSHRDEVIPGWFERVWKRWDQDKLLRELHPTLPSAYGFAERTAVPSVLSGALPAGDPRPPLPYSGPKASVVIPVWNGAEDLKACLASLESCSDAVAEVMVVDNGSEPPITVPEGVTLIRNASNLGFARASNQGLEAASSEIVLFLNDDTLVSREALVRLLESLQASPTIAAAGPYSNNAGHHQRLEPTYTTDANYALFAQDFAHRRARDEEVDMLVGFCLAVRKSVLDEIGGFDESFGIGLFEDNDLCYRMLRAGYKLVLSGGSYIHHHGSKSFFKLEREQPAFDASRQLRGNEQKFIAKWRQDLEFGFSTGLSGLGAERIKFEPANKPERQMEVLKQLREQADITLCMIVRDEERVLGACLKSALPFFKAIHILDTGSKDRTVEIARELGAEVREVTWPDSFAEARTASMSEASSRWIMWLDADDTLPLACGQEILAAAINAPPDVIGFVIPVRFVEEKGPGTSVDHVKLFRNYPGLKWEGRIHEQILGSLRSLAEKKGVSEGRIARLGAYVLHSGYDTSEEGQAKKNLRDDHLLKLDLQDRPNHPFVLFNLGMTAYYGGRHEDAAGWLRGSITHSQPNESHIRKAYALLGSALKILGRTGESKEVLELGLSNCPGDPDIQFYLAQHAAERGDHKEAVRLYESTLAADISGFFTSIDPGILGFKSRHNLALSYLALGSYSEARAQWLKALEETGREEIALSLHEQALLNGDFMTASEVTLWVENKVGRGGAWAAMTGASARATGLDAVPLFENEVRRNPENLAARRALCVHLLNTGRKQAAVPHLRVLDENAVPEGPYFLGVLAEEEGRYPLALSLLRRALGLNPSHEDTVRRIQRLESSIKPGP